MMEERLQLWLDQALATTRQRWALGVVAVLSIVAASIITGAGSGGGNELAIIIVAPTVLSVIAASGSGTHAGSLVIAIIGLEWITLVDDVATPRAIGVAACLYVFHAVTALIAATRHTTVIDPVVLIRWARRSVPVMVATVAVWWVVAVADGRNADGSEALTILGLVLVSAVLLALRRWILAGAPSPSDPQLATSASPSGKLGE